MASIKTYLVCPDSFKGSVSAPDAAHAIALGIRDIDKDANVIELPIADGGEGTLEALVPEERRIKTAVRAPDGTSMTGEYGYVEQTAVIEMAKVAGLPLMQTYGMNAETASTYAVGELIRDALDRGFCNLLLTVGGSGTNDGGSGMLEALGARFYDSDNHLIPTPMSGGKLYDIAKIDLTDLDKRLYQTAINFACDVTNPLVGPLGATMTYGKQKGATPEMLVRLERGMEHYADVLETLTGKPFRTVAGCGAGGGFPTPLVGLFDAKIRSGIASVLEVLVFDRHLQNTDLVITGEGRIDGQSAYGKAISGVASAAKKLGVRVWALCGITGDGAEQMKDHGIERIGEIRKIATSDEESIKDAAHLLRRLTASMLP
ncbi:MAG: glycerate kinase [Clostridia bacterium]|nr:glycerate kinase [Clostridia bacterium]